jgi:predicted nuclease of predicted toxin-antitoxin system
MWVPLEAPPKKLLREVLAKVTKRARFLVDESLGEGAARVIGELGYNVKFAPAIGLGGRSDVEVFAFAWAERRLLLTHDKDFLNDRDFPFHRNPGVIVLPGGHGRDHGLAAALAEVLRLMGNFQNLFPNAKIEISDDNTWNIRHFERDDGCIRQTRLRFGPHDQVWQWEEDDG